MTERTLTEPQPSVSVGGPSCCVGRERIVRPWRKSTFSGSSSECVEVAVATAGTVLVRNSNHPHAGTLAVAPGPMSTWLAACRAGALDDLTT